MTIDWGDVREEVAGWRPGEENVGILVAGGSRSGKTVGVLHGLALPLWEAGDYYLVAVNYGRSPVAERYEDLWLEGDRATIGAVYAKLAAHGAVILATDDTSSIQACLDYVYSAAARGLDRPVIVVLDECDQYREVAVFYAAKSQGHQILPIFISQRVAKGQIGTSREIVANCYNYLIYRVPAAEYQALWQYGIQIPQADYDWLWESEYRAVWQSATERGWRRVWPLWAGGPPTEGGEEDDQDDSEEDGREDHKVAPAPDSDEDADDAEGGGVSIPDEDEP